MSSPQTLAEFDSSSTPRPHPAIETVYLAPEVVVLDERNGRSARLNASAAATWLLLDGEITLAEVARDLGEIFSTPPETVLPGVLDACQEFAGLALLDVGDLDDLAEEVSDTGPKVLSRPPDP